MSFLFFSLCSLCIFVAKGEGIPEYEMLKRGMTQEERIHNGYYVAYKIAETLEKQFTSKEK